MNLQSSPKIVALVDKSTGKKSKRNPRYNLNYHCRKAPPKDIYRHIPVGGAAIVELQLMNKRGIAR
jgi:hypothetical protein